MAIHSSILAWIIPWAEEPVGLQSMEFSRPEYWSGLPCPPAGDLPDPAMEPTSLMSPALAGGLCSNSATWEALEQGGSVQFATKKDSRLFRGELSKRGGGG